VPRLGVSREPTTDPACWYADANDPIALKRGRTDGCESAGSLPRTWVNAQSLQDGQLTFVNRTPLIATLHSARPIDQLQIVTQIKGKVNTTARTLRGKVEEWDLRL
jgi:hypothetical protein